MYEYRMKVERVIDGDTIHADVDLGCDIHVHLILRLAGINAPELSTPEGPYAKTYLESLLAPGPVLLRTIKDHREKYGRYLADLFVGDLHINAAMVNTGHAVPYAG